MPNIRRFALFLVLLTLSGIGSVKGADTVSSSPEQIRKAADEEAGRLGFDVQKMNVKADQENSQWKEYSAKAPHPDLDAKLTGKKYSAVYYSSKKQDLGKDLWVFVERDSGKVIAVLRGK